MAVALAGLLLLLALAGIAQMTRDPERTTAQFAMAFALLLIVGLIVFVARGDLFRQSALDDGEGGCGWEKVC